MSSLSWPSIGFYCAFGIFVFYQQLHAAHFRGASQAFGFALSLSALLGMLTGLIYLIYYGIQVVWWAPLIIFVIGILTSMLGNLVELIIGKFALSFAGFIGWPLCAYFMFSYIPMST